nr:site-specific integrase [Roseospira goensis]
MGEVLTERSVKARKATDKRQEIPDAALNGLYLTVEPTGRKSWSLRYRWAGKPAKFRLGPYPALGLADARDMAKKGLRLLAAGADPRKAREAAERAERDAEQARQRDDVDAVITLFVERYAKGRNKSWAETERLLRKEALPLLKGKTIQEVQRRDIIEILDAIVDRGCPTLSNRVLAALRKMCAWCVERGILETSPCADVSAPAPKVTRDRTLTDTELKALWAATDRMGAFGPTYKLLVLTGCRRDEVCGMRWDELDLDKRTWTIPGTRTKNSRPHAVHLTDTAIKMIEAQPKIAPERGRKPVYVFTTGGTAPISGHSVAKKQCDRLMAELTGDEIQPWRVHDIRRTVASGMARLGINIATVEKCLNHVSGTFSGVVGVYQHHDFATEKRMAWDAWEAHVMRLVRGSEAGGTLVTLAGARSARGAPSP